MKNKGKKDRQPRGGGFPVVNIDTAIDLIKKASSGGWSMSKEVFAKAIGSSTLKSGSFLLKLAALRDYKLIDRGDTIKLTQLAKEIVAPVSQDRYRQHIQEAFLNSDIFRLLYERIRDGSGETTSDTIANLGVHDFKVALKRRDLFARNFITSGFTANLLEETADEKIRILHYAANSQELSKENETESTDITKQPEDQQEGMGHNFVMRDQGKGWSLTLATDAPLNTAIRKQMITIIELLEGEIFTEEN